MAHRSYSITVARPNRIRVIRMAVQVDTDHVRVSTYRLSTGVPLEDAKTDRILVAADKPIHAAGVS